MYWNHGNVNVIYNIWKVKTRWGQKRVSSLPFTLPITFSPYQDILESGSLKTVLPQVKAMLNTPIKTYTPSKDGLKDKATSGVDANENKTYTPPSSPTEGDNIAEGDLPGQLSRLLGKGKH